MGSFGTEMKADKKEEKEQECRKWKWWFHLQL